MITLGVDAAGSSGWAIVDTSAGRPRLVSYGVCRAQHDHIIDVVETAFAHHVEVAAVEWPYVDKSPAVAIKLGVIVGRWAQELDRVRIPWKGHNAQSWQAGLLAGLIGAASPRDQRKAAAARWVKAEFGVIVTGDEADAIGLATWRAKHAHHDRIIGAPPGQRHGFKIR